MQVKKVPAKPFYCSAKELTMAEIPRFTEKNLESSRKCSESFKD